MNCVGSYRQRRTGTLAITISGRAAGNGLGQLVVTGKAAFAGTVRVAVGTGFSPRRGEAFEIVRYQSRTGKLSRVAGSAFRVSYHSSSADAIYR